MACGLKMVKILLVIFNIFLFLFGLALVGVGLWSAVDKVFVASVIGDDLFSAASYMAMVVGLILLGVAVLGIIAARKERRLWVIVYFILLLVFFVALLLTAILAVVFKSELAEEMKDKMRSTLVSGYGGDDTITAAWDRLQRELGCCGVQADSTNGGSSSAVSDLERTRQDSWLLFRLTTWYQLGLQRDLDPMVHVPVSCCVYDDILRDYIDKLKCQTWRLGPPGNLARGIYNNALYYDGCFEKTQKYIGSHADILVACTFTFAFAMIGGLVLTLFLYKRLGESIRVIKENARA